MRMASAWISRRMTRSLWVGSLVIALAASALAGAGCGNSIDAAPAPTPTPTQETPTPTPGELSGTYAVSAATPDVFCDANNVHLTFNVPTVDITVSGGAFTP